MQINGREAHKKYNHYLLISNIKGPTHTNHYLIKIKYQEGNNNFTSIYSKLNV